MNFSDKYAKICQLKRWELPNGRVMAKFSLSSKQGKDASGKGVYGYFDGVAWGDVAEQFFTAGEGSTVSVEGFCKQEKWVDKETGKGRSAIRFVVMRVTKPNGDAIGVLGDGEGVAASVGAAGAGGPAEDDIPF